MSLWGREPDAVEMWWQAWLCVTTGMHAYDKVTLLKQKSLRLLIILKILLESLWSEKWLR